MSVVSDVRKRELLSEGTGRHMGLIPVVMAVSATLSRAAQAEDQLPMQPFGGVCKYTGGGKTTFEQWHNSQCLPVRCLRDCAALGAQQLDSDDPVGGEPEPASLSLSLSLSLMRCTILCLDNDADGVPNARPDYPCRKLWEWPINSSQNWLQNGQFCEATHQRACMAGRCMSPTELVVDALSRFEVPMEEYYLSWATPTTSLRVRQDVYQALTRRYIVQTLLRAPGPLGTPNWKAIERQDYEKVLAAEAERQAEEAAYQASEAARQAEAGERQREENTQPQETTP